MERFKARLIADWRKVGKRWSTQIVALGVIAQTVWAAMPVEARQLFPAPEYIGIGLGIAALIAMIFKQGKSDGQ